MSEGILLDEAFNPELENADEPAVESDETPAEAEPTEEPAAEEPEPEQEEVEDKTPPAGFVPKEALAEERQKRRELSERIARMEGRLEERREQPAPAASDEDLKAELEEYYADPVGALKRAKDEAKDEALATFRQEEINRRFARSQQRALKSHEDYEDVEKEFVEMAKANPSIGQELADQEDPAEWAYQFVKTKERMAAIKDLDEWKEAERARIREEIEKEAKTKAASDAADSVTPTNAGARSVGGTNPVKPKSEGALLEGLFALDEV